MFATAHWFTDTQRDELTTVVQCASPLLGSYINKAIVDSRLRPRCTLRIILPDVPIFIVEQNLVEILPVMLVVLNSRLGIT